MLCNVMLTTIIFNLNTYCMSGIVKLIVKLKSVYCKKKVNLKFITSNFV